MDEYSSFLQISMDLTCYVYCENIPLSPIQLVYIITDDQDIKLNSLNYQKKLQKLMTNEGLFFDNAFVTTPICCPSRYG